MCLSNFFLKGKFYDKVTKQIIHLWEEVLIDLDTFILEGVCGWDNKMG